MRSVQKPASGSRHFLLAAIVLVLLLTLTPSSGPTEAIPTFCILCGSFGTADFFLNVLMFVPVGYLTIQAFRNPSRALIFVISFTIAVELLQVLIPGRYPTLGDVAANALGGSLGIWAAYARTHRLATTHHKGFQAAARTLPFTLAVTLVLTVVLLQPALPESTYYGQWTADLGQFAQYGGQVRSARVGTVDLPGHRLDATETGAVHRIAGGAPLTVDFRAGSPTTSLAPVFSIFDEHQVEILVIGADADAIVVRMRRLSEALGLHAPEVRFDGAHPLEATESTLQFRLRAGSFCLRMTNTDMCTAIANPARGWSLFTGLSLPNWTLGFLDFGWLVLLGFLAVYIGARSHAMSPGWVWHSTMYLPVISYGAIWLLFQGNVSWVPGLAGLIAGSVGAARSYRNRVDN